MKKFFAFISIFLLIFSNSIGALEPGKWLFVKEKEYCYIGSLPTETDLPEDKKRGDTYILVYKMIGKPESIIQIEAGYNYKSEQNIGVKIDNTTFKFYSTYDVPDSAWTDSDDKVIFAMKKGLELTVTGESSRGTVTNDTYTLKGFTAAFNQIHDECK
tara:strand:- start:596 stop:1069 length:474 start_codon:yes stop_codon:yes gene_type:complete